LDKYTLHELLKAAVNGADRPLATDILDQLLAVFNHAFDMRKKVSMNMESLQALVIMMSTYGINIGTVQIALVLIANIELAAKEDYGRDFHLALHKIRAKYPYSYPTDDTSLKDMLQLLNSADSVRTLKEAPPPASANAVRSVLESMRTYVNNTTTAYADNDDESDYTESAYGATSDGDLTIRLSRRGRKKSTNKDKTKDDKDKEWTVVTKGYRPKVNETSKIVTTNNYSILTPANEPTSRDTTPPPIRTPTTHSTKNSSNKMNKHQRRALIRQHRRAVLQKLIKSEELFLDTAITQAEDEQNTMAKLNINDAKQAAINSAHPQTDKPCVRIMQQGRNMVHFIGSAFKRAVKTINNTKHVRFSLQHKVRTIKNNNVVMVTYDSGADGHYISEQDQAKVGLPLLCPSSKQVAVTNGTTNRGKNVTQLPFPTLSARAQTADTCREFPTSPISVGKVTDDGNVSIFTKDRVTVHDEQDVLITCQGEPLFIGVRDQHGRYHIPLTQHRCQWQLRKPMKKSKQALRQANSVYDLPSIEQAIKWMHAVCGYPVKSTWMRPIRAGNYVGWPMLTEQNVSKYYPKLDKTLKGHMNQARKNVRSTKAKQAPLELAEYPEMRGKKVQDIYISTYEVHETTFSDQTGQFPTRSKSGNKYIMIMVKINSSAILVEPMKSRKDAEMIRAYNALLLHLRRAGIVPKKHVMDNEVSENMKNHIKDNCRLTVELVPPGCH
jgi:hypothetical protein